MNWGNHNITCLLKISMMVMVSVSISCSSIITGNKGNEDSSNKYFIGRADTENFQESVKQILLEFDYHIEQYDNGPISSYIVTHWKVREPYPDEIDAGFEDAKTRLVITGMIDNSSFKRNNGFSYDCFLEVENHVFDGKDYVHYYEDEQFKNEIGDMVRSFSAILLNDD
jgi:hypothetical protein